MPDHINSKNNEKRLGEALDRIARTIPAAQVDQLQAYCELLWQSNEQLNLTRHLDFDTFAARDVVDAVELAQLLQPSESVLDVGSGGGVPGVLLAILRPDVTISLSESVGKKATALQRIVNQLGLGLPVHHCRAETLLGQMSFHTLTARAVGPLSKMLQAFAAHWPSIGRLLLVKGPRWIEERAEAREKGLLRGLELRRVAAYAMPGTEAESVILSVRPRETRTLVKPKSQSRGSQGHAKSRSKTAAAGRSKSARPKRARRRSS